MVRWELLGHRDYVNSVAVLDAYTTASASDDGSILIYDVAQERSRSHLFANYSIQ